MSEKREEMLRDATDLLAQYMSLEVPMPGARELPRVCDLLLAAKAGDTTAFNYTRRGYLEAFGVAFRPSNSRVYFWRDHLNRNAKKFCGWPKKDIKYLDSRLMNLSGAKREKWPFYNLTFRDQRMRVSISLPWPTVDTLISLAIELELNRSLAKNAPPHPATILNDILKAMPPEQNSIDNVMETLKSWRRIAMAGKFNYDKRGSAILLEDFGVKYQKKTDTVFFNPKRLLTAQRRSGEWETFSASDIQSALMNLFASAMISRIRMRSRNGKARQLRSVKAPWSEVEAQGRLDKPEPAKEVTVECYSPAIETAEDPAPNDAADAASDLEALDGDGFLSHILAYTVTLVDEKTIGQELMSAIYNPDEEERFKSELMLKYLPVSVANRTVVFDVEKYRRLCLTRETTGDIDVSLQGFKQHFHAIPDASVFPGGTFRIQIPMELVRRAVGEPAWEMA